MNHLTSLPLSTFIFAIAITIPVSDASAADNPCEGLKGFDRTHCRTEQKILIKHDGVIPEDLCAIGVKKVGDEHRYCQSLNKYERIQRNRSNASQSAADADRFLQRRKRAIRNIIKEPEEDVEEVIEEVVEEEKDECANLKGDEYPLCVTNRKLNEAGEAIPSCQIGERRTLLQGVFCVQKGKLDRQNRTQEVRRNEQRARRSGYTQNIRQRQIQVQQKAIESQELLNVRYQSRTQNLRQQYETNRLRIRRRNTLQNATEREQESNVVKPLPLPPQRARRRADDGNKLRDASVQRRLLRIQRGIDRANHPNAR